MKRRSLAVLFLSVVMTLGAVGISAMAAVGWEQENGTWVYYNSNGSRVTDEWRTGADGYGRYLDSNGIMAADRWVDNDNYYVDSSGVAVANKWLQVTNTEKESGYDWYYFSQTGKCVKEKWEKVDNKWYYFNDTGVMQTGWVLDNMYYCEQSGAMVTGWQKLLPPDENNDNDHRNSPYSSADDGKYWYYFGTNGKKFVPSDSDDNTKQKKINGVYYCFSEDGAMQTGWVCMTGDDSDDIEDYRYVDSNGQVRVGWYSAEPPENLQNKYEHDVEWFYFNNKGVPRVGPEKGNASANDLVKINGNTYLFNENGVPAYGLQKVYMNNEETDYTAYYFGKRSQSSMLKGKQTIRENGESRQYYFTSTGRGYTGVHDNYLYYMGRLQKADSSSKYEVFSIPYSGGVRNYVVNTSGRIAKSTTVKNRDGVKYKTNGNGILIQEDGESVDGGTYLTPEEPDWSSDGD